MMKYMQYMQYLLLIHVQVALMAVNFQFYWFLEQIFYLKNIEMKSINQSTKTSLPLTSSIGLETIVVPSFSIVKSESNVK